MVLALGAAPAVGATPHHPAPSARSREADAAAVARGLSLEHACLNAVRAHRAAPRMAQPEPADRARHDAAATHLDRAEQAALSGHGQVCEDEVSLAAASWQ